MNKRRIAFVFFLICFLVIPSVFTSIPHAKGSGVVYVDSGDMFGFTNGSLNFSTSQTFTSISETGNYWYFDQVGISLDGANCTALSWIANNRTILSLTSLGGTCTILMNVSALNPSVTVQGATTYTLNSSGFLNVTETSFSTATVTIILSPIIISNFVISSYNLAPNVPFIFNATIYEEWGITDLTTVNIELSSEYQIGLSWSLGGFSLPYGNTVCSLDTSGCSVTQTDPYTYVLSWKLAFLGSQPEQTVSVLGSGTVASDIYGNTATNSLTNLATYSGTPSGPGYTPPNNPENQTQPEQPTNQTNPSNYTEPENPFTPIPPLQVQIPYSPLILVFGVIAILVVVGVTGYYSGRRKNPLSEAQKEWKKQNQGKNPKWNKD